MKPILARLEQFQQRHRSVALPLAVFKRFGEHHGSRLAATISYYSFFSVFPLLLALVTVLGFVLEDDPDLRDRVVDGALGQIPVIGAQIGDSSQPLTGSVVTLVVGLAVAVWAGLAAVGALQQALDELWDVPVFERPKFVGKNARSLAFLVAFAVGLAAATLLSSITSLFDLGPAAGIVGFVAAVVVNTGLLVMTYSVLAARRRPIRQLLPGAVVGGVALSGLLQLGRFVVERYIAGASDTYGTFAVVIALLSWFHLVSRIVLLAAEANEVVANGLWPRTVLAGGPLLDADRKAALLDMQAVQRDARFGFAVAVDDTVVGTETTPAEAAAAEAAEAAEPGESTRQSTMSR